MPVKKWVIYTRYSSDKQSDKSNDDQEREVRQLFAKMGLKGSDVVIVIHDRAESGTKNDRPGFQQLLQLARTEKSLVIGLDDQARLSRNDDVLGIIKDFVFHGHRVVTGDGVDTNEEGWRLKVRVLGLHNATTIDETGRRVRRGLRGRVLEDCSAGDFPYGYESYFLDPEAAARYSGRGAKPAKGIRIFEEEAIWVLCIFAWFNAGMSLQKIAEKLKAEGAPVGRRGKKWSAKRVSRTLSNKKYAGLDWNWGRTTTIRDSDGRKKQVPVNGEEVTTRQRSGLAIIDLATWEAAQVRLAKLVDLYGHKDGQKKRGPKVHHTCAYPTDAFASLFVCGDCGSKMHYNRSGDRIYRLCSNSGDGPNDCHAKTRVPVHEARQVIVGFLKALFLSMPEWISTMLATMRAEIIEQATRSPALLAQYSQQLRDAQQRRENLWTLGEKGKITSEAFRERLELLDSEVKRLSHFIEELESQRRHEILMPDDAWVAEQLRNFGQMLGDEDPITCNLLRELLGTVRVYRVLPPGKKRGYQQLKFRLAAWDVIRLAMGTTLPTELNHLVRHSPALLDAKSAEFCLDVGGPTRMDDLGPVIAEMRAASILWKEICKVTGLGLGPAYVCWKRYVQAQQQSERPNKKDDPLDDRPENDEAA